MKELSLFLLKNAFGSRMKKGIRTFCTGDGSTSTLHQGPMAAVAPPADSPEPEQEQEHSPTLEEMILQLELEEEITRAQKEDRYRRRMSSVNSSDILRSAQNALNQYPRFSLDGRDAMYRSSFRNSGQPKAVQPGRRSVCGPADFSYNHGIRTRICGERQPEKVPPAGESVVWCKPGVVAKLMGLEAIPVPVARSRHIRKQDTNPRSSIVKENFRRRAERHELERKIAVNRRERSNLGSCSRNGTYCVMKPVAAEPIIDTSRTGTDHWAMKHCM